MSNAARKGRVTKSVHIPLAQLDTLDAAVDLSGMSESAYIGSAALRQAERDLAAAGLRLGTPESEQGV